jgi:hypothetical protein
MWRVRSIVALPTIWSIACPPAAPPAPRDHTVRCDDAPLVTLDELAAGRHAGERIAFEAVPVADHTETLKSCGQDYPCCNHVVGSYMVELPGRVRIMLQGPFRCSGTECEWHCEPFGDRPTSSVRFVGVNEIELASGAPWGASAWFTVEKYCR